MSEATTPPAGGFPTPDGATSDPPMEFVVRTTPPPVVAAVYTIVPVRMRTEAAADRAMRALAEAEHNRRERCGGFDTRPIRDADPTADWAFPGSLVQRAVAHLDESIPNGQRARTEAALTALMIGTCMLLRSLHDRGVIVHADEYSDGQPR